MIFRAMKVKQLTFIVFVDRIVLMQSSEKRKMKSSLKRRTIELLSTIPVGVGFAVLFWKIGLYVSLQLFLTIVCWGAVFVIIDIVVMLIQKKIAEKQSKKPKRKDPFAD
ncbi:MAG: hypothetical protein MR423_00430 [Firmicutes bacterium]|nr:hypothetical protein [Bacillota bacterium]